LEIGNWAYPTILEVSGAYNFFLAFSLRDLGAYGIKVS
jgi:hypothetical protein